MRIVFMSVIVLFLSACYDSGEDSQAKDTFSAPAPELNSVTDRGLGDPYSGRGLQGPPIDEEDTEEEKKKKTPDDNEY